MKKQHLYIGGQSVEAATYEPLHAPYSGEQLAEVASATAEEAEKAIAAAAQASAGMRRMPAHQRSAILYQLSVLLAQREKKQRASLRWKRRSRSRPRGPRWTGPWRRTVLPPRKRSA